ncbi:MAG: CHAT domain-containing protein, partial [Hyphomonadaceae bacterium]|nr:CHAT domain-containing protein [Hyphomonadaceae bacterium]
GLRVLLGGRADETTVKQAIGGYRYLHFATHGLLAGDLGLPEPAIALAASAEDDGYLMASEVERLRLNADLAVLSACNTGAGRIVAGEGVIGIARAFLRAGARSTMVSLWPVDDEGASVLMADFYRRLRAGGTPAAVLRESALAMRAQAPYSHPYYWAPFILIAR